MEIHYESPPGLAKPSAPFAQMGRVRASGFLYIAGQLSMDATGAVVGGGDLDAQCEQVFTNIGIALISQGVSWQNVVAFTTYVVGAENLAAIGAFLRRFPTLFGDGGYPPNTLLIVERLAQPECKIEIKTVAALDT